MSRIGKLPVDIPAGVEVFVDGGVVSVKGRKGNLDFSFPIGVSVTVKEGRVIVSRDSDEKRDRALHGLVRALVHNMVVGVSQGFEKKLEIVGVGYRAQVAGKKITFNLGFSHPVEMEAPEGVTVDIEKDTKYIVVSGFDKQKVGQFASEIRALRPPEPYKGSGIRYVGEYVPRKAGKAASK
jgi:large subunit ribosomal protein L6